MDSLWFSNIIQVKARKNKKDNTEKNFAPKVNSTFLGKTVELFLELKQWFPPGRGASGWGWKQTSNVLSQWFGVAFSSWAVLLKDLACRQNLDPYSLQRKSWARMSNVDDYLKIEKIGVFMSWHIILIPVYRWGDLWDCLQGKMQENRRNCRHEEDKAGVRAGGGKL